MADTVNINTDIWATLKSDTLANTQNILNDAYNLFEQDGTLLGKEPRLFQMGIDGALTHTMQNVADDTTNLNTSKIAQKILTRYCN